MSEKFLFVLAGYDDSTEEVLANYQKNMINAGFCGTQTPHLPHHLTLGKFDLGEETKLITKLNTISYSMSAFELTFNHIGIFSGSKVLFIAPDVNLELIKLKTFFSSIDNWTAHSTILIDEPTVIMQALPVLIDVFQPFRGKISYLYLYEFWPTRLIHRVTLSNNSECLL